MEFFTEAVWFGNTILPRWLALLYLVGGIGAVTIFIGLILACIAGLVTFIKYSFRSRR